MNHVLTDHAQKRMKQRGISLQQLDAILNYGDERFVHGSVSYFHSLKSENEMKNEGYTPSNIEKCRGVYAVCNGEVIITVCHQFN